ncbi:hypothetical protein [Leptospira idonii]|uniref:Uncharacterized protein n=1 Tax=Leptospira idonii TaxID=1193500 RepID=A0A4R9LZ93_9LEPT|nr:hypothetical protein [Leptospira idonii]TGN19680.1 hypothetical protein EHS15_07835 [Leptospira idonii]
MKSNQKRRWEELLEDASFETKISNQVHSRFRKEQTRNRTVAGFVFTLFVAANLWTFRDFVFDHNDLSTDLSFVIEEMNSGLLVHLGED